MQNPIQRYQQVIKTGLENINCIVPPTDSLGGLYLGDIISTKKTELLEKYKITAILSCSVQSKSTAENIETKFLTALDNVNYDMKQHFEETFDWIKQRIDKGKNILVHCHAGVSRSASVVIAYLMKSNGLEFQQAFKLVKSKRPRIKPNESFMKQLQQYESQLKNNKTDSLGKQKIKKQIETGNLLEKNKQNQKVIQVPKDFPKIHRNNSNFIKTEPQIYENFKNKQNISKNTNVKQNYYPSPHQNMNYNIQYNPYLIPQQNIHQNKPIFLKTINLAQTNRSQRQSFEKPLVFISTFNQVNSQNQIFRKSQISRPSITPAIQNVNTPLSSVQTKSKGINLLKNMMPSRI